MKGLELAAQYFEEYGRALIETEFAPYADRIAAGLVGQGSERYGFDDVVSRDHDYCAGFCLWISSEDDALFGFALEKAYRRLASEFSGVSTREKERGGSSRYGVITFDAFFEPLVGPRYAALTPEDYLYTPSHYLADASNGTVFYDRGGTFTGIYESIRDGMPEDVRLKKLAAALAGMAQSGQYNYARTLSHGEQGAAVLALDEFVRCAAAAIFQARAWKAGPLDPYVPPRREASLFFLSPGALPGLFYLRTVRASGAADGQPRTLQGYALSRERSTAGSAWSLNWARRLSLWI
ncbi:MAG: DUF4037 domain-containing protein, partial [Eubacteriales bacterium]